MSRRKSEGNMPITTCSFMLGLQPNATYHHYGIQLEKLVSTVFDEPGIYCKTSPNSTSPPSSLSLAENDKPYVAFELQKPYTGPVMSRFNNTLVIKQNQIGAHLAQSEDWLALEKDFVAISGCLEAFLKNQKQDSFWTVPPCPSQYGYTTFLPALKLRAATRNAQRAFATYAAYISFLLTIGRYSSYDDGQMSISDVILAAGLDERLGGIATQLDGGRIGAVVDQLHTSWINLCPFFMEAGAPIWLHWNKEEEKHVSDPRVWCSVFQPPRPGVNPPQLAEPLHNGQKIGETFASFIERRQRLNKERFASLGQIEKVHIAQRESANRHKPLPGKKGATVFKWEMKGDNSGRERNQMPRNLVDIEWNNYGFRQKVYDAHADQWDLCSELSCGSDSNDEDSNSDDGMGTMKGVDIVMRDPTPPAPQPPNISLRSRDFVMHVANPTNMTPSHRGRSFLRSRPLLKPPSRSRSQRHSWSRPLSISPQPNERHSSGRDTEFQPHLRINTHGSPVMRFMKLEPSEESRRCSRSLSPRHREYPLRQRSPYRGENWQSSQLYPRSRSSSFGQVRRRSQSEARQRSRSISRQRADPPPRLTLQQRFSVGSDVPQRYRCSRSRSPISGNGRQQRQCLPYQHVVHSDSPLGGFGHNSCSPGLQECHQLSNRPIREVLHYRFGFLYPTSSDSRTPKANPLKRWKDVCSIVGGSGGMSSDSPIFSLFVDDICQNNLAALTQRWDIGNHSGCLSHCAGNSLRIELMDFEYPLVDSDVQLRCMLHPSQSSSFVWKPVVSASTALEIYRRGFDDTTTIVQYLVKHMISFATLQAISSPPPARCIDLQLLSLRTRQQKHHYTLKQDYLPYQDQKESFLKTD